MKECITSTDSMVKKRLTATRAKNQNNNAVIRRALAETGLYRWQLADILDCSVETVQRRLRHELPMEEQTRIAQLIREAASHE